VHLCVWTHLHAYLFVYLGFRVQEVQYRGICNALQLQIIINVCIAIVCMCSEGRKG